MSTPVTEYVVVSVDVQDRQLTTIDFGMPIIIGLSTKPSAWATGQRTQEYGDAADVATDFGVTSKIYKAVAALATSRTPRTFKVGIVLSGDANIAAGLTAIEAYDSSWYGVVTTYRLEADINAVAAWVEAATFKHIYIGCTEDASVLNAGDSSGIASDLMGFAYNRTALLWHHNGGIDLTGISVVIASGVATATKTSHGLRVGDSITLAGNAASQANGDKTVLTVPTADTFTYDATGAADDAVADTQTAFARYTFPEARWMGQGLSADVGAEDWSFKPLVGQEPTPTTLLTLAQQHTAKGKKANIYTTINGVGCTQIGNMASGRFIDIQIGIDWLQARLTEALITRRANSPKIPYTQQGINSLVGDLSGPLALGNARGLLGPLVDPAKNGAPYEIIMPQLADISDADRVARNLPAAAVTVQFQGSIITFNVNVAALI